ncbi:caffeoyl-CoA O-methyltransferase [Capnocytophaga haemolytica]|uniref:Methyltransferase n=1 Tax=Capnocytophaga haemolytica TaxID=45243 RepID=A0AAX2H1G8_9FLAO|nr:O-methyltransferase [Capnocytophaga haemolytica]AMD85637.1 methyltransferase [Capnocytophaga haemolytica]SFN89465.1 caffeoyl-CoA O-methyltransferase [Capnocytophaga haemolytica]SNV16651.1 Putative O-methyltransferase MSMEG_5073 [Capnocytophaga haemolytica]
MHFISEDLEDYASQHTDSEPPLLSELSRRTHLSVLQPRMLSGHLQGRFLSLISKLIAPKTILEIGTYTGYATLCLAEGLQQGGTLHTIDIKEELQDLQREFFDRSGYGAQIVQHLGEAATVIPTLTDRFDLVFIDADKRNYALYFDLIIEKMNRGGVILSDNVLWSGKVVEEVKPSDKHTQALLAYNQKLKDDPRLETVLLPIRDGITLSRVK